MTTATATATTAIKPGTAAPQADDDAIAVSPATVALSDADADTTADPSGAIRLCLAPLGIDCRDPDFPARFIDFCAANDCYDMEVNEAGELVILPMVGFKGSRQEMQSAIELGIWTLRKRRRQRVVNQPFSPALRRGARPRRRLDRPGTLRCRHRCGTGHRIPRRPRFRPGNPLPQRQPAPPATQNAPLDGRRRPPGMAHRSPTTAASISTAPASRNRKCWKTPQRWTGRMCCPASSLPSAATSLTCRSIISGASRTAPTEKRHYDYCHRHCYHRH